jgi:hypothetical protein
MAIAMPQAWFGILVSVIGNVLFILAPFAALVSLSCSPIAPEQFYAFPIASMIIATGDFVFAVGTVASLPSVLQGPIYNNMVVEVMFAVGSVLSAVAGIILFIYVAMMRRRARDAAHDHHHHDHTRPATILYQPVDGVYASAPINAAPMPAAYGSAPPQTYVYSDVK